MILVDFSGFMFADIAVAANYNLDMSERGLRKLMLTNILYISKMFSEEYGEIVLCLDGWNYWRKDIFPNYKAGRQEKRETDLKIDWDDIFKKVNNITEELKNILPCKILKIQKLEADDIIAVLTKYNKDKEKILIVSNDKDFAQLHVYDNVEQYYPIKKVKKKVENPKEYLLELVVKGDRCDGIPNIRSNINIFVEGGKQKPITVSFMKKVYNDINSLEAFEKRRLEENRELIDFEKIPKKYEEEIMQEYNSCKVVKDMMKFWQYCVSSKVADNYQDCIKKLYEGIENV